MTPAEIDDRARKVVVDYFQQVRRKTVTLTYETDFGADLGADSLDLIEIVMHLEEAFDVEIPDAEAEQNKTYGQTVAWLVTKLGSQAVTGAGWSKERTDAADELLFRGEDAPECCIACALQFKEGDMVLSDAGGGALHVTCCGPERESYTNGNGDPLGPDDPIPTGYRWARWPAAAVSA